MDTLKLNYAYKKQTTLILLWNILKWMCGLHAKQIYFANEKNF